MLFELNSAFYTQKSSIAILKSISNRLNYKGIYYVFPLLLVLLKQFWVLKFEVKKL